jgi:ribosomal protein S18 acetylase RimI-like enzyme
MCYQEMNMLETRILTREDIPDVVEAWNRSLKYDSVTQEQFEWVILDDPNCEPEGNIIALDQGQIVGFVSVVSHGGQPFQKDDGFIKGVFVLDGYWDQGVGESLLEQAENYLVSRGKRTIQMTAYIDGRYFFNGIDLRYEKLMTLFANCGYERLWDWGEIYVIEDVAVDLRDFTPTAYQLGARKRAAAIGVKIMPYHPAMLDRMRTFVQKLAYWQWFPSGWEDGYVDRGYHLVAVKDDGVDETHPIVGWADYRPDPQDGAFGAIGVLEAYRRHGIGTCLVLESMLRMKDQGTPKATAGWVDALPFYMKNGWHVSREWAPFQKKLHV